MPQMVKTLPTMQETPVRSLGWEDPLEMEMAISCLENPMDRGAWQATVHGVAKSRTRLSDFTLTFLYHSLLMAPRICSYTLTLSRTEHTHSALSQSCRDFLYRNVCMYRFAV